MSPPPPPPEPGPPPKRRLGGGGGALLRLAPPAEAVALALEARGVVLGALALGARLLDGAHELGLLAAVLDAQRRLQRAQRAQRLPALRRRVARRAAPRLLVDAQPLLDAARAEDVAAAELQRAVVVALAERVGADAAELGLGVGGRCGGRGGQRGCRGGRRERGRFKLGRLHRRREVCDHVTTRLQPAQRLCAAHSV